jgi:hypothetical protein
VPVALATVGALLMGSTCGDRDQAQPQESEAATPGSTAPAITCGEAAPDGGTIDVVESGFSMLNEPDEDPELSYGVVLENTSRDYLAILTLVVIHLTDADGDRANDIIKSPPSPPAQAVHTIFPGQRVGIGEEIAIDLDAIHEHTVEVGVSAWIPIEQVRDVGKATATDLEFDGAAGEPARIGFRVVPTVDPSGSGPSSVSISEAQSWAIFRDASGDIAGGASGPPGTSWNGMTDTNPITGFVQISPVPNRADETRTEIYVSPFYPPYRFRPC